MEHIKIENVEAWNTAKNEDFVVKDTILKSDNLFVERNKTEATAGSEQPEEERKIAP